MKKSLLLMIVPFLLVGCGNSKEPGYPSGNTPNSSAFSKALNLFNKKNFYVKSVSEAGEILGEDVVSEAQYDGKIALVDNEDYYDYSRIDEGIGVIYWLQEDGSYKTQQVNLPKDHIDIAVQATFKVSDFEEGFDGFYLKDSLLATYSVSEFKAYAVGNAEKLVFEYVAVSYVEVTNTTMSIPMTAEFYNFGKVKLSLPTNISNS